MAIEVGSGDGVLRHETVEIHVSQIKQHRVNGSVLEISFSGGDSLSTLSLWAEKATFEDPVNIKVLMIVSHSGNRSPIFLTNAKILQAREDGMRWNLIINFDEKRSNLTTLTGLPQVRRPEDPDNRPDRVRLSIPGELYRRLSNAGHRNVNELAIKLLEEYA